MEISEMYAAADRRYYNQHRWQMWAFLILLLVGAAIVLVPLLDALDRDNTRTYQGIVLQRPAYMNNGTQLATITISYIDGDATVKFHDDTLPLVDTKYARGLGHGTVGGVMVALGVMLLVISAVLLVAYLVGKNDFCDKQVQVWISSGEIDLPGPLIKRTNMGEEGKI